MIFPPVLVGIDAVIVMATYQPVCAGVRFTVETGAARLHNRLLPDDGSCMNRNMSEQVL